MQETVDGAPGGKARAPPPAAMAPGSTPGRAPTRPPWRQGCSARESQQGLRPASTNVLVKRVFFWFMAVVNLKLYKFSWPFQWMACGLSGPFMSAL